jgi:hypothetical protein
LDLFSLCYNNSQERLDRCAWISAFSSTLSKKDIVNAIQSAEYDIIINENSHLGIPLDIKIFRGRNMPEGKKRGMGELQAFVEFIDPNSVNRLLKLASTTGFLLSGQKMKAFKAGSKPDLLLNKKRPRK